MQSRQKRTTPGQVAARSLVAWLSLLSCSRVDSPNQFDTEAAGTTDGGTEEGGGSETSTGTVPPEDGTCRDDADCGALRCVGGLCHGCGVHADCPDGTRCNGNMVCHPLEDFPLCARLDAPVCGDGQVDALEECDQASECPTCDDGQTPPTWIAAVDIRGMALVADGSVALCRLGDELALHDADGSLVWSVTVDERIAGLAADSSGTLYTAGRYDLVPGEPGPWVASWDAAGSSRWSVETTTPGLLYAVAVDDERLVVGGAIEQLNAPSGRAWLVQYDLDGNVQWSEKIASHTAITELVLTGGEIAVMASRLSSPPTVSLIRIDDTGATRWSVDSGPVYTASYGPAGVVADGTGGTWIYGERDGGPWVQRHDADGNVLAELGCIGGNSGRVSHMAVDAQGHVALAALISDGGLEPTSATVWIAQLESNTVTSATTLPSQDPILRTFALGWRGDGSLAVGLGETSPTGARIDLVMP